jgi:UDP-N-acetylglucosamine--N-acetylmuramyl-(pentapeptide) pyrophosphoryl-undecaprenol N-acetylglucosamine transferase
MTNTNIPRILVAAGGTGGHVFPALAIADEIRKIRPDAEYLFVGTKERIEAHVVPQRGYPFTTIWISGFHRNLRPANILFPLKLIVSIVQSFILVRRFRPTVAVGTGGYVCGPILSMASRFGVPVVLHESNSMPGVTVRMLAKRAAAIFVGFEATKQHLPNRAAVEVVGTPTRSLLNVSSRDQGVKSFGLSAEKKTVLIFGGSLGAASINQAVRNRLLSSARENGFQVIWQTGRAELVNGEEIKGIGWTGPFIDRMEDAYAVADLVVCRSGASTLAELSLVGKPAILIPYPHAAADHQTENARTMEEAGAALVIPDKNLMAQLSEAVVRLLKDESQRKKMSEAARRLGRTDTAVIIAKRVVQLASH